MSLVWTEWRNKNKRKKYLLSLLLYFYLFISSLVLAVLFRELHNISWSYLPPSLMNEHNVHAIHGSIASYMYSWQKQREIWIFEFNFINLSSSQPCSNIKGSRAQISTNKMMAHFDGQTHARAYYSHYASKCVTLRDPSRPILSKEPAMFVLYTFLLWKINLTVVGEYSPLWKKKPNNFE